MKSPIWKSTLPLLAGLVALGAWSPKLADAIVEEARGLRFPLASAPSEAIIPIMVGGPLPWMSR